MQINYVENTKTGERYSLIKHKSGLNLYLYPKSGFHSTYAVFGTRYGSINTQFKSDGKLISVPDGIAHYLEHKMFESEDGDAFSKYAKTGASANAYTSFDKTCYLFSTTRNFKQSLEILIDLIQTPYFTDENVEKERGIIEQEILMYDDEPEWKVMFNLLGAMYHNHPVKIDIAGTVESISHITKEKLYECYNSYYNINNLVLAVVGNIDEKEILDVLDSKLRFKEEVKIENVFPTEQREIVKKEIEQKFSINLPLFQLGFKEDANEVRKTAKKCAVTEIILEAVAGKASELYKKLMDESLINSQSFYTEFFEGPYYCAEIFAGQSREPKKAAEVIKEYLNDIKSKGIKEDDFKSARNTIYARNIATFNSNEAIGSMLINNYFAGRKAFEFVDEIPKITLEDVNSALKNMFEEKYSSLSLVTSI